MSIQKKKNGYLVVARVRGNGKIVDRRKTLKNATKEEAKAFLETLKRDIRAGKQPDETRSLKLQVAYFKDILALFRVKNKKGKTRFSQSYENLLKQLEEQFGDVPVIEFVDRFENIIDNMKRNPNKKGNSPASINRRISVVKAAFEIAFVTGKISANPITKHKFPKVREIPRDNVITQEQQKKIIEEASKDKRIAYIAPLLQYAFQVPVRKSELLAMKVGDVEVCRNRVRVRNGTTKNDKGTWKPIPPNMLDYFTRRTKEAKSVDESVFYRTIRGSRKDRSGDSSRIVSVGDFKKAFKKACENAKVSNLRFHDTRHIAATALIDNGTPSRIVMQVAGWKTDMLSTYYHRDEEKAIEQVIFSSNYESNVKAM